MEDTKYEQQRHRSINHHLDGLQQQQQQQQQQLGQNHEQHVYGDDPVVDVNHVGGISSFLSSSSHPFGLLFDTFVPISSIICICVILRYTLLQQPQQRHSQQGQQLLNILGLICLFFWFVSVILSIQCSDFDTSNIFVTSPLEWNPNLGSDIMGIIILFTIPILFITSILWMYRHYNTILQDVLIWKHSIPIWILVLLNSYRMDGLLSLWEPYLHGKSIPNYLAVQTLLLDGIIGITAIPIALLLYVRRPNLTPQCLLRQRQFQAYYMNKSKRRRRRRRGRRQGREDDDDDESDYHNSLFRKLKFFSTSSMSSSNKSRRRWQRSTSLKQQLQQLLYNIPISLHDIVWFWNSLGLYDLTSCYIILLLNFLQIGPNSITTPHLSIVGYHPFPLLLLFQAPLAILIHLYMLCTPSTWFLLLVQENVVVDIDNNNYYELFGNSSNNDNADTAIDDGGGDGGSSTGYGNSTTTSINNRGGGSSKISQTLLPY